MKSEISSVLQPCVGRPVAVFGCGVSGYAAADLLRSQGFGVSLFDMHGKDGAQTTFNAETAKEYGLVVYSPGFSQEHEWLNAAREAGCLCLPEIDLSALFWPGKIVAVTGTNGKTTLSEFLAKALIVAGYKAAATGNIGYAFASLCLDAPDENTIAVCEVSSFQAEGIQHFRPDAVLWTNFSEDHLDRYPDMQAYFEAKWRLVEMLKGDALIMGERIARAADRIYGCKLPATARNAHPRDEHVRQAAVGTVFEEMPQLENFAHAYAFWECSGLDINLLREAARFFQLHTHRMAKVESVDGVTYWNDSKATNFSAALAAANRFNRPILWIGGGKYKGGNLGRFALRLGGRLRRAFLIGETAESLAATFEAVHVPAQAFPTLEEAVYAAHQEAKEGEDVVLSPGFASMDMFTNYEERGKIFEAAVFGLKKLSTV